MTGAGNKPYPPCRQKEINYNDWLYMALLTGVTDLITLMAYTISFLKQYYQKNRLTKHGVGEGSATVTPYLTHAHEE